MKKVILLKYICIITLAFTTQIAFAQTVVVDQSFNNGDTGSQIGFGFNAEVFDAAYLPSGKVIVVGDFMTYNGVACQKIARLNADGTLDETFDTSVGANTTITEVEILSDGKILIAGFFTQYKGVARKNIARLNADGTLDTSFDVAGGPDNVPTEIVPLSNGKIITAGWFTSFNGTIQNRIARLNADGSLDATFNTGTGFNNAINALAIQSDGKIAAVGNFTQYNGTNRSHIARLNADGSLDGTFDPGTGTDNNISSVLIMPSGKIVIAGSFNNYNSTSSSNIAQLNTDGSRDTNFTTSLNSSGMGLALQNGKIIVTGYFTTVNNVSRNRIARLYSDGLLDTGFDPGTGTITALDRNPVVVNSNNWKTLVFGGITSYNGKYVGKLLQIQEHGAIDQTFNSPTLYGFENYVGSMAVQADGKVIVGGSFTGYNGVPAIRLVRVNTNGTIDATFNTGTGFNGEITGIKIDNNGKIIVAGYYAVYNGLSKRTLTRLNTDGTPDATFNAGTGFTGGSVEDITLQSDGKIIATGSFTSYNGVTRNKIARINTDGSLDTSFDPGAGVGGATINGVASQSDDKVIIVGSFFSFAGTTRNFAARLNSNGTLDTSFDPGTALGNNAFAVVVQPDGKIIVGGGGGVFTRFNTDGSVDGTFNKGTGFNGVIRHLLLQTDGKIVVAGTFTTYNSTSQNYLTRLNSDATLDVTFNSGTASPDIFAIAQNAGGDFFIGGTFKQFAGIGRNRFAKLVVLKPLTISGITANNKIYDRTTTATLSGAPVLIGVEAGDAGNVSLNAGNVTATFNNASVAANKPVTVSGYTLTGSAAYKYGIVQPTGLTAEITRKEVTVTGLSVVDKVYSESTVATITGSPVLNGVIAGDNIVLTGILTAQFSDRFAGNGKTVTLSGYTLAGTQPTNYTLTLPTLTGNITQKPLTVNLAINDKIYDGTTQATYSSIPSLIGIVSGDVVNLNGTIIATFSSPNVGANKTVTLAGYSISGTSAANYTITATTNTIANILPRELTVTGITVNTKVYDGSTDATVTGTASLQGVVAGQNITLTGTPIFDFTTKDTGTDKAVTGAGYTISGTGATNYSLAQPILTGAITARPVTLSGLSITDKAYDGSSAASLSSAPSLSNTINGDDVSLNTSNVTADFENANAGENKTVTVSNLMLTGSDAFNYSIQESYTTTGNINKAAQTITYMAIEDKLPTDNPFAIDASSSTGLPLTISIVSGPATYGNDLITLTGESGTVTVKIEQSGNENYLAVSVLDDFDVLEDPIMDAEISIERAIEMYPVPARDKLIIRSSNAGLRYVTIYDVAGVKLMNVNLNGEDQYEVAVDRYPAGVILIDVGTTAREQIIKRAVIVK